MLDTYTSIYKPLRSNKKSTTEEFIKKAILVHGDRYNYSKVEYKNCGSKLIIICNLHGEFKQSPNHHLRNHGCPKCGNLSNINTFKEKSTLIHRDKYDYSLVAYIHTNTKVIIICPIHGEFQLTPNAHLQGRGCPKCSNIEERKRKTYSNKDFIQKSIKIHGEGKYDYSKVVYTHSRDKVIIVCPIHGEFKQSPNHHLRGHNCPKCVKDNARIREGIKFENKYNIATIYLLKCTNDIETFLKIGITSRTIEKRYSRNNTMPYEYETLYQWIGDSKTVVDIEEEIKTKFTYHKPEIMFGGGHTETLHISQEKDILDFLNIHFSVSFDNLSAV